MRYLSAYSAVQIRAERMAHRLPRRPLSTIRESMLRTTRDLTYNGAGVRGSSFEIVALRVNVTP
jgi:hypothetical protein